MPATVLRQRTANESMGTGCTSVNRYERMPFAASTSAAARANSSDLRRVS